MHRPELHQPKAIDSTQVSLRLDPCFRSRNSLLSNGRPPTATLRRRPTSGTCTTMAGVYPRTTIRHRTLWFRKAAEQGNADAQISLGYLYLDGEGVPQDATSGGCCGLARRPIRAMPGRSGCSGVCTSTGIGVPQDYAEAYFWFDLAAAGEPGRLGRETGCEVIETKPRLT